MATTTMTKSPLRITVSGTTEHDINVDAVIPDGDGEALIQLNSGSEVQFNAEDNAIDASSGGVTTANPKLVCTVLKGRRLRYKGGSGSEVIEISILK
jgi:hypothetical protein